MRTLQMVPASVVWTDATDGPLGHNPPRRPHDDSCCGPDADARRRAVHERPWVYLTQMHGDSVVVVTELTDPGPEADAAVTTVPNVTLAVATADCAPLALSSAEGVIGAVHAGWRGLEAGVISKAVEKMRSLGAMSIDGALGPCIHAECYEFAEDGLQPLVERWGDGVRATTTGGAPALDLPAAVAIECERAGVDLIHVDAACTACNPDFFSHRARGDEERQVMLVWRNA